VSRVPDAALVALTHIPIRICVHAGHHAALRYPMIAKAFVLT
jgi:hypothetical protein